MFNVIEPTNFDISLINNIAVQKRSAGNPGTRSKIKYKDIITAFDIETTRLTVGIDEDGKPIQHSVMYVWQWQFGNDVTIIGRTWEQFLLLCQHINSALNENEYLCVFVHNLSYEFQFLRGIYQFQPEEVFALDSRKVLKCKMFNHIEMRCSYLHSNMSLYE
jgi:hypothetical protein